MLPKPEHLADEYAAPFKERGVVEAYQHRPPYPSELFDILVGLLPKEPRAVLDIGCGTGNIARLLVQLVERVDAVDFSPAMIELGKTLPNGDHPALHWVCGRVEEVALRGPYGLVTAGQSLHWMDWETVLPRLRTLLAPGGYLAIIEQEEPPTPWAAALAVIIPRYSTNRHYRPWDLVEELQQRGLFRKQGERRTAPMKFARSIDEYIEAFHARSSLARERMGPEAADAFDHEVKTAVALHCPDAQLALETVAVVEWGEPLKPGRGTPSIRLHG